MAIGGLYSEFPRSSVAMFCAYWGVMALLLFVALGIALLDIAYIRVQYAAGKRQAYLDTLGDESFRIAVRQAQNATRKSNGAACHLNPTDDKNRKDPSRT